eukprot:TRINITY_DN2334_c0_g1_i2.p2 TRINITY_DN2334_c0_g1~~TRINITY_DN2334_c0_g1_i2.p2  ORF type:complete len:138 (-),score=4.53 TRINITY_DN2334_c0_g1_i2:26-439(-)
MMSEFSPSISIDWKSLLQIPERFHDTCTAPDKLNSIANEYECALRIASKRIDILVDLGGPPSLEIASLRTAPIQISWMGTPFTTGSRHFDYYVTDSVLTPNNTIYESAFVEKLVRLPDSTFLTHHRSAVCAVCHLWN